MHSQFDFPEIEGRLEWEGEEYTGSHPNRQLAWTTLSTVENLRETYDFVSQTAGDDTDDGKMFQHILVKQGANALESLYWLVKHHQYFSARSRARYLYEVYCCLLGLNDNQSWAATEWSNTRKALKEAYKSGTAEPFEADADPLHDFIDAGQDRIDDLTRTDSVSTFYNLLSNRGSHPASLTGSSVDGSRSTDSGRDLFRMGLVLSFGIACQYIKTYTGTETAQRIRERVDETIVEIKLALQPYGLPVIFRDELLLWNPAASLDHSM